MKKITLVLLAIFVWMSLPLVTISAQSGEVIQSFETSVVLSEDGQARVRETIVYDFGTNERRGIFRDIPVIFEVSEGRGYKTPIDVRSVTRDGMREMFQLEASSPEFQRIRIGDPDVFISSVHTYTIEYMLSNVVIQADDGNDIFRFDTPGTGWEVPTQRAVISVDSAVTANTTLCYQGVAGSDVQDCIVEQSENQSEVASSRALGAGETITAEVVFAGDSFSQYAVIEDIDLTNESILGFLIPLLFGGVAGFFGIQKVIGYLAYRRRRSQELVYARYEPPADMSAAEMGLLIDNSADAAELTATLIGLAVHGHMKIKLVKEKKFFSKAEYSFIKTVDAPAPTDANDAAIYNAIFSGDKTEVSSKSLAKSTVFQSANQGFSEDLIRSLTEKGFYKKVNIFRRGLPNRMSDVGYEKWAEIEGFREFLQLTEKDRIDFHEAPERKPADFSALLPFAVALGVEEKWAKQFEHLDVDVSDWYIGNANVGTYVLASHISNLSNGIAAASIAANKSSGTSGVGGGFSGGGFGGGGGGSW